MGNKKIAVTMEDGREILFNAKQKLIKTSSLNDDGMVEVKLDFVNGLARKFVTPGIEMLTRLAIHGAEQKLGDEIAGKSDIDDCVLAVEALIDRLESGKWTKARTPGMAGTSILIQALVEHSGKDVSVIKEFLKDKVHAQKQALKSNPAIKVIVERLEEEKTARLAEKNPTLVVDTDALLAEI